MKRIYLDHSATTPIDGRVFEAMLPYLKEKFGNPSSVHLFGQEARIAVDTARRQVSKLIGARENEVVFTSGGTEANNLGIRGIAEANAHRGRHIITSEIEHSSVKGAVAQLEERGWEITRVPVSSEGVIAASDVAAALRDDTVLVSIMLANNEIGTIQPLNQIAEILQAGKAETGRTVYLHTDAVQAVGRLPIQVDQIGCDLMSMSAHKLYAPKGCGALYLKRGVRLVPQNVGGHQERERRAGTESVPLIVAFGEAARLAGLELEARANHVANLRDRFEQGVERRVDDIVFNGRGADRLSHLSNISFRFIEGEGLLINLDMQGIAVSTGSACSSGSLEPSPVIRALGRNDELARGSIRFSFGKDNTIEDVDYTLEALPRAVNTLRQLSPLFNKCKRETVSSV